MQITPLPQGFGANVSGFAVHHGGGSEDIARLKQAYADHHLLIFRSCGSVAAERQVEIAGWFGPTGANSDAQGRPWSVLSNDEAAGSEVLPFHCDISFMEYPIEGLCLHPIALPRDSTSTSFVSNAVGWDHLPETMQDELRNVKARHYYAEGASLNLDWPVLEHWHPVCLPHSETGRPLLFVTEHHVDRIEGMTEERSAEVLKLLFACLYAQERRYEHVWREGDLVIWNNLAVQHARHPRRKAFGRAARALQRVALGKANFMDQLERVQRRQAELQI